MQNIRTVIFVSVAFSGLALGVIMPILVPLVRELQITELEAGIMVSAGSLAMALCGMLWGSLSDRWGRKQVLLIGFAGLSIGYMLFTTIAWMGINGAIAAAYIFLAITAGRTFTGMFMSAVPTAAQALMADNTSESERSAGMAIIGAANGLGMVLGPAIGGLLALASILLPLTMTAFLCAVGFIFVLLVIPNSEKKKTIKKDRLSLLNPTLLPWLLAGFTIFFGIITMQISAGFYFQDTLGLTNEETGPRLAVALTIVGLALLIIQVLQVKVLKLSAWTLVFLGVIVWLVATTILLATNTFPLYCVAYGFAGIGSGLLVPGFMAGASLSVDASKQGAVAGVVASVQGVAAIIAPVVSTAVYKLEPSAPMLLAAALMVTLLVIFVVIRTKIVAPATQG